MTARRVVLSLLVVAATSACRPDDQRTDTVDPAAVAGSLNMEVAAQLDSGNAAYRAGSLDAAATHYQRVADLDPETAAGWFGLYMVASARGDSVAAAAALERAREAAPGASLLHPPGTNR